MANKEAIDAIIKKIKAVSGEDMANAARKYMEKGAAQSTAGVTREMLENPNQDTIAGADYEQRKAAAQKTMTGAIGQIIRATFNSLDHSGNVNEAKFLHSLGSQKHHGKVPLDSYKAYLKALATPSEDGYVRHKAMGESLLVNGGAVVPPDFYSEVIDFLRPRLAVRALGARSLPMPRGAITIPFVSNGIVAGNNIEGNNAPQSTATTGQIMLVAKDIDVIVPVSNQLLQDASPEADRFITQDLAAAMGFKEDFDLLRGTGANGQMRGLRNQAGTTLTATNAANVAGGSTVAEITMDLVRFPLALENFNIMITKAGWVFSNRTKWALMALRDGVGGFLYKAEMLNGTLWGIPFVSTTTQPNNLDTTSGVLSGKESEILFADFAEILIGDTQTMTIEPVRYGTYYDSVSGTTISGLSSNQTVLVARERLDIIDRRRGQSIANMTKVTWGA